MSNNVEALVKRENDFWKKYLDKFDNENTDIKEYYDFNGYYHKTAKSLQWALYFDNCNDKEITLIFDENGNCLGCEKKEDVRILISIEDIPNFEEFSIRENL